MLRTFIFLGACAVFCSGQATIIDTGSTNRPGLSVTLDEHGSQATVERRGGSKQVVKLAKDVCDRFMRDLKAAGPLDELPKTHCMKSVSFGSALYIEYNGVRSADLSCPQHDPRAVALKNDAAEILAAGGSHAYHVYY